MIGWRIVPWVRTQHVLNHTSIPRHIPVGSCALDGARVDFRFEWFLYRVWLGLIVFKREPAQDEPGDGGKNKRKYAD